MDLELVSAVDAALWTFGAVATAALVVRAAARQGARAVWVPACLAAVLTCLSHAPGLWDGQAPGTVAALVLVIGGVAAWAMTVMALIGVHHRTDLLRAYLDLGGAVLLVTAIVLAVATGPVSAATGLSGAAVAMVLAVPAGAALLALMAVIGLLAAHALHNARGCLVAGAAITLTAGEIAEALVRTGALDPDAWTGVHQGAVALALAALASASWVRAPVVVVMEESARAVMVSPLIQLVAVGALLGIGQRVQLPMAAVALTLVSMAVQLVCVLLVYRVITSLHGSRRQALTDELTGLGNRRALATVLAGIGPGRALALTLVDLDRFKEVNDVLGHDAGDELLQQVASRLLHLAEAGEVVVRQGGDEFAVVVPHASAAIAAQRGARIVAALAEPFTLGSHQVSIAANIGVAAAPEHATGAEELLRIADSAMYRAKVASGGVVVYDADVDAARRADLELVADLRDAVANDQLDVHFQPQLDAATGALVGVEALVRWRHPTRGMLPPFAFLPLAEKNGLMDALTRQVLDQALAAKTDIDGGTGSRMSVNLSATSLLDPHLVTTVSTLLLNHGVPPGELMLEITETELMLDAEVSRRVVTELVELGVGVSIDDYGTGHSSLSYLKDLPATELKLDRSFVAELATDTRIATIVRSTVDLAHSLGLRLVAEGVEDEQTLEQLVALGVDVTQGYHHSRPVPAGELARWAAARRIAAPAR